jgi:maltooligosyltrehalose trehalohydrolase
VSPPRIWAPSARRVEVVVGDVRLPAEPSGGGTWRGPALVPGQRYAISVDGGPPRPDPRSPFQPDGVHAASCWLDVEPHRAAIQQVPLAEALIYELHVGTFSPAGTFEGAIPHLDHLVALGVTHVELMPIAQFSGTHGWGYDGVGLFAPHAPYGGPSGLSRLIAACHARGLAVLLDVVHNHFGPDGNYWSELGPYTTNRHRTPWGDAINLDTEGSAEVRRFLIDSALGWLRDYGADGLRLDAIHALVDDSARHFVRQLVDEVRELERQLDRRLVVIGEYDDHDPNAVTPSGWGLDAHWNDDFHHAVHALVTGERSGYYVDFCAAGTIAKVLEHGYVLDGGPSTFRGRPHGAPYGRLPRDRLVGYIQSHDQIGNRALGERLHHLAGLDRARIAAALLFTSPFVPMIFQGEEWAASTPFLYFAELESAALREAVREGRRAEHAGAGWEAAPDPTLPSTRVASTLRWDERDRGEHAEMLAWDRALIARRRATPALRACGPEDTRVATEPGLVTIVRGSHALICNLREAPVAVNLDGVVLSSKKLSSSRALPAQACALVER